METIYQQYLEEEDKVSWFTSPFTTGTEVLEIPQLGAESFKLIFQLYHYWMKEKSSARFLQELKTKDWGACTAEELQKMSECFHSTFTKINKTIINKML